jgi:general secretion pathway protein A
MAYQQTRPEPASAPATAKNPAAVTGTRAGVGAQAGKPDAAAVFVWPAGVPLAQSKAIAFTALFRAWGASYAGTDFQSAAVCRQAGEFGLRCRAARGGLDELRQANRPAVLHLRTAEGEDFFATLTSLDDGAARFAVGNENRSVALSALAAQWTGEYTLLWRAPPDGLRTIHPGEHGAAVEWLSKALAQVQGAASTGNDNVYDDALMARVKQFQLARGLTPDGAVGPQTLIRLSSAADRAAPRLFPEPAAR